MSHSIQNRSVRRVLLSQSLGSVLKKSGIERVQALANISRSRFVVITTQPVHRLQIHPIVHN